MVTDINNINSAQNFAYGVSSSKMVKNDVSADENQTASNPIESAKAEAPAYPAYSPIQPKAAQKVGEVKIPNAGNAQVYELANGQKLVTIKKSGPVTVNTYVRVGSMNETDDIRGISHYIEHNLFNGSSELKPNEFVEDVKKMGGVYNAATGFASTNYFVSSPVHSKEDLDQIFKIHANMLEAPTFTPETLEKEKSIVSSEIQMLEDQPFQKAENLLIKNLFQVPTKSNDLIGGTVGNIQNLNRNKVNEYYQRYYTPDNMVTVVAGDVNPDEVAEKLNKLFISRRKPATDKRVETLKPIEKSFRQDVGCTSISSPSVNVGFAGPKNNDLKGELAANALLLSLAGNDNSKMQKALEKFNTRADYTTEMVSNNPEDRSVVMINAAFDDNNAEEGLKSIYQSIQDAKDEPVSEKELQAIKNSLKRDYKTTAESSMGLTQMVGSATITNKLDDISKSYEMIDQLTPGDIQQAAKDFMDLNKASIVVLHPQPKQKDVSFKGGFHSDAAEKLDLGPVEEYNLSNNMQVDYHSADSAFGYLSMTLQNDKVQNQKPGCDDVLSSMLNMGSSVTPKEQFFDKALNAGTDISFYAKNNKLFVSARTEPNNIKSAADLSKEVLMAPNLTQENLDKAKAELKLEYESSPKSPDDKVGEELCPGNANYTSYEKRMQNLDNITLDDVKNLYLNVVSSAQAKTVVSAPDKEKQRNLTSLQNIPLRFTPYESKFAPDTSELKENKVITHAEDRNQADIEKVYKIKTSGNVKDTASMMVLNSVLSDGSNGLFEDLREKEKLAYAVRSKFTTNNQEGFLQLVIKTTTQDPENGLEHHNNVQKSLEGFQRHVDSLVQKPVDEEELKEAKLAVLSKILFSAESTEGKHGLIGKNIGTPYGSDYTKELVSAIQKITPADVQKSAQINLTKPAVTSIIASQKTLDANADYLKSQGSVRQA